MEHKRGFRGQVEAVEINVPAEERRDSEIGIGSAKDKRVELQEVKQEPCLESLRDGVEAVR